MFIRYLCTVSSKPGEYWGDLGFEYFEALYAAGFIARVFANGAGEPYGRWEPHSEDFIRPVPDKNFINIVCAPVRDLCIAHTTGAINIGITAPTQAVDDKASEILSSYDLVVVPSFCVEQPPMAKVVPASEFAAEIGRL